jgi:hypothetical protein
MTWASNWDRPRETWSCAAGGTSCRWSPTSGQETVIAVVQTTEFVLSADCWLSPAWATAATTAVPPPPISRAAAATTALVLDRERL